MGGSNALVGKLGKACFSMCLQGIEVQIFSYYSKGYTPVRSFSVQDGISQGQMLAGAIQEHVGRFIHLSRVLYTAKVLTDVCVRIHTLLLKHAC